MSLSSLAQDILTGEWRLKRMLAKEQYEFAKKTQAQRMQLYAGAQPGVNRPTPNQLTSPEDYRPAYERIVLIRAARQMEEDFPFFDAILRDFETYVVGELKYTPATASAEADKVIAEFLEWKFDQIDYTNRFDLCSLAKLAVRSMKRDGEMGSIYRNLGNDVKLQFISGDRIGNPMTGTSAVPYNFGGIIVNPKTGAPSSFQIFKRLPKLNAYQFEEEVSADNFRHYFNPFRIDQYHGVTVFKNGIENGFDGKQIMDFTKQNIKFRASQLPFVLNEQGRPRASGYETVPSSLNGTPQPMSIKTDGVVQNFLKLDEGVMEYPNDFPNGQFQNAMTELKRECAVGAGLPLEFVYRSEAGGVVQRFYVEKAEATFRADRHLLRRTLLNPTKNRIIQAGIDSGELDLRSYGILSTDIARFRGTWQMGRSVPVDYSRETDADIKQLDAGLVSPYDLASDAGRDLNVVLEERKKYTTDVFKAAQQVSQDTGRPFDEVLPYIVKIFPNPAPIASGSASESTQTASAED
jgi:Phage portal protein, lambda family